MIRAPGNEQVVIRPAWAFRDAPEWGLPSSLEGLSGTAVADRFCAWAGRSGRRYIFSVFALDAQADAASVPLARAAIALMVRRPAQGSRRVVWAERIETEETVAAVRRAAAAAQAGPEGHEMHLHFLSVEPGERRAAFADLALPRLEPAEPRGVLLRLAG